MNIRTLFLIILLGGSSYTMDKSWISSYVESEKRVKEEQEKKTAQDIKNIAQKVKVEADTASQATQELITLLKNASISKSWDDFQAARPLQVQALEKIKTLLKAGANPNILFNAEHKWNSSLVTDERTNPLMYVLEEFLPETRSAIARIFIDAGTDINFSSNHNNTPLHLAMDQNLFDIAQLLLEHGANPNTPHIYRKFTPLYLAVKEKKYPLIQLLIARGADPMWNYEDVYDLAVANNDMPALTILLSSKIDNVIESKALYRAVENNNFEMISLLLAHGANPQLEIVTPSGGTESAESPLQLAHRIHSSSKIINALKNPPSYKLSAEQIRKANEALKEYIAHGSYGDSWQRTRAVKLLLFRGANPNISIDHKRGDGSIYKESLITFAINKHLTELVRHLLNLGISPNHIDLITLLQEAITGNQHGSADNRNIIKMLLDYGADPDLASSFTPDTPLILAIKGYAYLKDHNIPKLLLDAHANPNIQNKVDGSTPLISAVKPDGYGFGNTTPFIELILLSLQAGADPLITDNRGNTALGYVQKRLDQARNETERAAYIDIIEMFNDPEKIRKSGLERIK